MVGIIILLVASLISKYFFKTFCLIRGVLGIPCPGCGITRALISLLKLDFNKAFFYHPLVYVLIILCILYIFKKDFFKNIFFLMSLVFLFVFVYIYRLILYFPNKEPLSLNKSALIFKIFIFIFKIFINILN